MIYLYGITNRSSVPLPDCKGFGDTPICCLTCQEITAIYSRLDPSWKAGELPASEENVWKHEAVLEALMVDCAVLPVRFGTFYSDEAALETALLAHYDRFVAGLRHVQGKLELSLRVLWKKEDDRPIPDEPCGEGSNYPMPDSGTTYLLKRYKAEHWNRERRARAETLVSSIKGALNGHCVDSSYEVVTTPGLSIKASYLVAKDHKADFCQEVEQLISHYQDLFFFLTGPWPPYTFVPG